MKRREVIKRSAALFTVMGTLPGVVLQTGCSPSMESWLPRFFSEEEGKLVRVAIDVLIPRSAAPSATDVRVHTFIDDMMKDIYAEEAQQKMKEALQQLEVTSNELVGSDFIDLEEEEKNSVMIAFSNYEDGKYYQPLKSLTLKGYFRTEQVCTQVLRHVSIPGKYEGCVDLQPEDTLWAE